MSIEKFYIEYYDKNSKDYWEILHLIKKLLP